mmetsp:Transcript_4141/g.10509  ORF Transcript_4141/g.10509 Transcript_4141/m.10509 type:complete len:829 (-) Transcript_4141:230-2716(-)
MTSWLGSLWGGSHGSSLPYNIKSDPVSPSTKHGSHGWAVHDATQKSDGGEVTAFQASKAELAKTPLRRNNSIADARYTDTSQTQLIPALHHFHRIKRLIHPRILRAHATLDTDYPDEAKPAPGLDALEKTAATGTLIIVTERARPLDDWLEDLNPHTAQANAAAVSWGIHNIVEALGFLHAQAKLAHGMICPDAVFVTPAGDFKLGGFDLITPVGIADGGGGPTPHFRKYDGLVCPADYRSPERAGQRYDVLQQSAPVHSVDCYSLAVLIEYIYTHPNAGTGGQVPPPLKKALMRMKNDSPKLRPRLAPLLKCPVFDNPYVKAEMFLDEVMSKPIEEKIMFLQSLPDVLNRGALNESVAIHKILPLLVMGLKSSAGNESAMTQDVNRREVLAIVPLLFQIAESYLAKTPELFQRHITPLVPLLFAINDRGVRGSVLQKISLLEGQMEKAAINSAVFEPMCSGFTDSSGALRELTLKSTVVLVPKLNAANLEKLVRYLVRMQSDPEASIRTNTVIFIGKIAPNLTDMSRQKLILPAFMRSMKDPFTPCRLSALRAVITCREYFTQRDVAEKVLPSVVPHTLDADNDVRMEAFKVVDALLVGLREESKKMAKDDAERIAAATCGMNTLGAPTGSGSIPEAPTSGSYLSGLSSWMTTTTNSQPTENKANSAAAKNASNGPSSLAAAQKAGPAAPKFSSLSLSDAQIGGAANYNSKTSGGWSDDEDIMASPAKGSTGDGWDDDDFGMSAGGGGGAKKNDEDDDDFFASFNSKPARPAGGKVGGLGVSRISMSKKAGSSLTSKAAPKIKKQLPKPAVKKLPANDIMDDGWDDF